MWFFFSVIFVTLWLVPAAVGYVMGRWVPFGVRLLPVPIVIWIGYHCCQSSMHAFGEMFLTPLAIYIVADVMGLIKRSRQTGKPFWQRYNLDWMALGAAGVTFMIIYVHPSA